MFENITMGENVELIAIGDSCSVYQICSSAGDGVMTVYKVFEGIYIAYNDFHTLKCKSDFHSDTDMLCIDHCREGRIEQEMENGTRRYLGAGDLRIDNRTKHNGNFYFPLSHYHGMMVFFEIEKAERSIVEVFPNFPVSVSKLRDKYCATNSMYIVRSDETIEHIFSELYAVPKQIREYYFKIKIFEMLLFLDGLELNESEERHPYFYKSQTEKVKSMYELMTGDLKRHYTLEELSERYNISLTAMKSCFKAIYGEPVFTFMRKYRMNRAATLLLTTEKNIADIANEVGYESASKFASAFKKEMGLLPLTYRKYGKE